MNLESSKVIKIKYAKDDTRRLEKVFIGDWIDLSVDDDLDLHIGQFKLANLGVAMRLPEGFEAYVIPRSSLFGRYGIIQGNHFGLIDGTYCGNEDWWRFPAYATTDVHVPRHTRICQFRIQRVQPTIVFEEVSELPNKSRGGFGSTGGY